MYVRWVVRRHKNTLAADMEFHDAYLVESYRLESSQPRQRTICYLGNLRKIDGVFPPIECELFLLRAQHRLRGIAEVENINIDAVMTMLRQWWLFMTPEDSEAAHQASMASFREWWAQYGDNEENSYSARAVGEG